MKQKEIEERRRKEEQKEKRKQDLITNTKMPQRLMADEQKRKEKQEKIKSLKPSDIDPECQFNPKIKKNPPKLDDTQKQKASENLYKKKQETKKESTQAKPFQLSEK